MPIRPITVRVKEWDEAALKALLDRVGLPEVHRIPPLHLLRLEPPEGTDIPALLATLEADPLVVHAYEVELAPIQTGSVRRAVGSTDPQLNTQWHLIRHDFLGAWRFTRGAGAKVGNADTGSSPVTDPDYQPIASGHGKGPASDNPNNPADEVYWFSDDSGGGSYFSHGTITSSIMCCEKRGNGIKGSAAAPDCEFYMGRLQNAQGFLDSYAAMAEWTWMADNGCRAINNSWGNNIGNTPTQLVTDFGAAIDYCWSKNCIVTVCAMNFGYVLGGTGQRSSNGILTPAMNTTTTKWPHALIVGGISAVGDTNAFLDYPGEPASDWGPLVDIVAAAQETWTLSLDPVNAAPLVQSPHWGTSFATPLVVATIGLMCAAYPGLTAQNCWDILKATADGYRIEQTPDFYTGISQADYLGPNSEYPGFYYGVPENNFDLTGNPLPGGTDLTWQGYGNGNQRSLHPSVNTFPNAKVLNACKAVLKAFTYDPANVHNVYPYLQAWGPGSLYVERRGTMFAFDSGTGNVTQTLNGPVAIEVNGFSSDPITTVELWLGSTKIYDGPPRILQGIASSSGTAQDLKVVAHTASGSATETYSDFVVASLRITPGTYVIDAAHGADDVSVGDWNTSVNYAYGLFNFDPNAPGLILNAPWTSGDGDLDCNTVRMGVLFRGITLDGGISKVILRLYVTDFDPPGYVDPYSPAYPAGELYYAHIYGAKKFGIAPGYNDAPWPSAPGWGNLPASPLIVSGLGVRYDGMVHYPTSQYGPNAEMAWPTGTRQWYPTRFDSDYGGAASVDTSGVGLMTTARTIQGIPRGYGYVEFDVTEQVKEILAYDFAVPAWTARRYSLFEIQNNDINQYTQEPWWNAYKGPVWAPQPTVIASNGYVYVYMGNGVAWQNEYYNFPRGADSNSTTEPSGTVIGGEEQPDGPGTAIWRCVKQGQSRRWASGDNLAFIIVPRNPVWPLGGHPTIRTSQDAQAFGVPIGTASYIFPEQGVAGWRTFAAGDLADPTKYPTLLVYTESASEGSLRPNVSLDISSNAVYAAGAVSISTNIHPTFTADAVWALTGISLALHPAFTADGAWSAPMLVALPGFSMGLSSDAVALGAASFLRRNLRMGTGYVYAYVGPSYDEALSFIVHPTMAQTRLFTALGTLSLPAHVASTIVRTVIATEGLVLAAHPDTDTGFGDHWNLTAPFPAHPLLTLKGTFRGKSTLPLLRAHPTLSFAPGVSINRALRFGPFHVSMGQVAFGPEIVPPFATHAGVAFDSGLEGTDHLSFPVTSRLNQKGEVGMTSVLPPLGATSDLALAYLRERSNVLLARAVTDMVFDTSFEAVGRSFYYGHVRMRLVGGLEMKDALRFVAHPRIRFEIAPKKKPKGVAQPYQTTIYTPGGIVIGEQTVVATSEEEARAVAAREGAGALTSKEKPAYFSDPMEEMELAEHEAGTVLKP